MRKTKIAVKKAVPPAKNHRASGRYPHTRVWGDTLPWRRMRSGRRQGRARVQTSAHASARFLAAALLALGVAGLALPGRASTPEAEISPLVQDWFALLEARTGEARDFERFLAGPAFEFEVAEGRPVGLSELSARRRELQGSFVEIEHRVGEVRIEPAGEGLYRAHFAVDRHAVDHEGTPHVARRQVTWLVRVDAGGAPIILRIDEQRVLAHPGTGTKIVCY